MLVQKDERLQGWQTFQDFIMRRYELATRMVKVRECRLAAMTDRADLRWKPF